MNLRWWWRELEVISIFEIGEEEEGGKRMNSLLFTVYRGALCIPIAFWIFRSGFDFRTRGKFGG